MKKIYLTLIIALSLFSLVSAITIGTILTQNQLDNQDVMNTDLEDNFARDNGKVIHNREGNYEVFYVEVLSIDKQILINETNNETYWTGDYEVVEKEFPIYADVLRWKTRAEEVGLNQAKKELKQWLKVKKSRIEEAEKRKIMELQTDTNNLDDFELDDLEI